MNKRDIPHGTNDQTVRAFMRALLADVKALERMINEGLIETGVRRIGAEQEMVLIDSALRPAPVATEVLAKIDDPRFTTELARFNLEVNLDPCVFDAGCLRNMEATLEDAINLADKAAGECDASVLLTGILPTLAASDVGVHNMTPVQRYADLNNEISRMRGRDFHIVLKGLDEFDMTSDNVMLESCNTSFQIHFQVGPEEFAKLYNIAQVVTAPVMAAAVNSPLLLGKRLWQETRVALFERSVDTRSSVHQARGHRGRVNFGDNWVKESALEIFREDIARYRVVLTTERSKNPAELIDQGIAPKLSALCLHNGTVWRWNRACYGVNDGVAHLRIENRALPAGPTILDQVANASLFYGLMIALAEDYPEAHKVFAFDDARHNFLAAARYGLNAQFNWIHGERHSASDLLLTHLIPLARQGLAQRGVPSEDIDRYLGTVEERVKASQTGSQWILNSLAEMGDEGTAEIRMRNLTAAMVSNWRSGKAVHQWELADLQESQDWVHNYEHVGQFMVTDLFTVRPGDLVDLATSVMEWEHVRHVPVEDDEGKLVGLVCHRTLLHMLSQKAAKGGEPLAVHEVMDSDPVTVLPDTPTLEALDALLNSPAGCLLVAEGDRLLGIVTERDFVSAAAWLLAQHLGRTDNDD